MINEILKVFNEMYPNADCELTYNNDYELLIKIILSAQTTDKAVNKVCVLLFEKYPLLSDLCKAAVSDVERIILSLGLAKTKSKNIIECCKMVMQNFHGEIPKEYNDLVKLSGVGRKTANVFLAVFHNIPRFAVDTHVLRVANRLKLSNSKDPLTVEKCLTKIIPESKWIKTHHQFIHFGRYFCTAKPKHCDLCKLNKICKYYNEKDI